MAGGKPPNPSGFFAVHQTDYLRSPKIASVFLTCANGAGILSRNEGKRE